MKGKVLIAGGSGLVGKRLSQLLIEAGYEVIILSRSKKEGSKGLKYVSWSPQNQTISEDALTADHVINLAGAGIADRPWTKSRKKELIDSRLNSTSFLSEYYSKNKNNIKTYIGASAIGYYGEGGDKIQTEDQSPSKSSFMTDLCRDWETAHLGLSNCIEKVFVLRIGIVLSTLGGAYPKMRLPFKMGVGTYFGSGEQYYSWIHIDDLARMFIYLIESQNGESTYNAVSPDPISNKSMILAIKESLGLTGLVVPSPAFALKLAMGEMSKVILNSNRVSSKKIEQSGFNFQFPEIKSAIKDLEERSI